MITKTYLPVLPVQIDGMGIVHHATYPLWFEKGRKDLLKKAGVSKALLYEKGLLLPLSELECKFRSPARFGEWIAIDTKILDLSCVKITFGYEIYEKENGRLLATGRTAHAWTNNMIEPINIEKAAPEIYQTLRRHC